MAKIQRGIFGGFSGTIGGMVFSSWKGRPVVKKLPVRSKKDPSPAQLEQRVKFTLLGNFFKPLVPVLNKAFEKSKLHMTGFNKAISDNKDIITGDYPDFRIDYTKVILCKEEVGRKDAVTVAAGADGKLIFTVGKNALYDMRTMSTLFFIAAYEEESERWIYKMDPVLSDDQTCELNLNPFQSKAVHTYAGIMPYVGKYTSSLYTGMVSIP
jgi:hypothetical protein